MALEISTPIALDAGTRAAVRALAHTIEAHDGQPPLSDQGLSRLSSDSVRHLLAHDASRLTGYAQLDRTAMEIAADASGVAALLDAVGRDAVQVWSHGHRSPVGPALEARGYEHVRVLHQLRRDLIDPLPPAPLPPGVDLRAFVVGADEAEWLRVNAAAFAEHAEQGRWTLADLQAREAEAWFDSAGFLLAVRGRELVGFHWTKIHDDGLGEVYVLGVDPAAQGMKLGPALLSRGLEHLRERGCPRALLYVDESNTGAMRLYQRFGFGSYDVDVQWHAGPATVAR